MAQDIRPLPLWECILFIAGGLVAIKFGGDFVVDGRDHRGRRPGLSQNLIGLTIVAVGTSLPNWSPRLWLHGRKSWIWRWEM